TLKAYRGQIIEYSSRAKKVRVSKLIDISRSILEIDNLYSSSPCPTLFKERLRLQTEYNLLSTDRATHLITKSRFAVYDSAQQARQAQSIRLIPKIYSETGETVTDHRDINDTFKEYYSVYTALNNSLLGGQISNEEILRAIKSLKCNKHLDQTVIVQNSIRNVRPNFAPCSKT
ncbi:hypothetical protein F7725_021418, partial [Dissostichus mawsoni]